MKERLKHVIEREFKPEFIGRIDEVVVFRKLRRDDLKQIVDIELSKVRARLAERGLKLELTDEAREFIIDKGGDTDYGARPLRRSVSTYIEDPLSEELLRGAFEGKGRIIVTVKEVADQKQLEFVGSNAPEGELAAVGAGSEKESSPPVG
jgi:ATP-dependent Clp protease ATP-binding subunit ClpC